MASWIQLDAPLTFSMGIFFLGGQRWMGISWKVFKLIQTSLPMCQTQQNTWLYPQQCNQVVGKTSYWLSRSWHEEHCITQLIGIQSSGITQVHFCLQATLRGVIWATQPWASWWPSHSELACELLVFHWAFICLGPIHGIGADMHLGLQLKHAGILFLTVLQLDCIDMALLNSSLCFCFSCCTSQWSRYFSWDI